MKDLNNRLLQIIKSDNVDKLREIIAEVGLDSIKYIDSKYKKYIINSSIDHNAHKITQFLLQKNMNINADIMDTFIYIGWYEELDIILHKHKKYLIRHINPNSIYSTTDIPLNIVNFYTINNKYKTLKILLDHGADLDYIDRDGVSCRQYFEMNNNYYLIERYYSEKLQPLKKIFAKHTIQNFILKKYFYHPNSKYLQRIISGFLT
jgi:hypothetical protein